MILHSNGIKIIVGNDKQTTETKSQPCQSSSGFLYAEGSLQESWEGIFL